MTGIDWTNPLQKISKYFTIKEAIFLPRWGRLANEIDGLTDQVEDSLLKFFWQLDVVREYLNKPINVHVSFRPAAYNKLIKGAKRSAHLCQGDWAACDFSVAGLDCDKAREIIVPKLEEWQFRCENVPGGNWVHLDNRPLTENGLRFFKP